MKTILLSLALAAVATVSNAETFQLKANLSVDADTLYVNSGGHRDAIANKNGQFEVTRDLDKATELTISLKKYAMPGDAMIKFMAMPGETATVRGNLDYFELGGSEFYQQYNMMCKAVEPAEQIQETNIKWGENLRKKKVDNDSTFATFQILRKDYLSKLANASSQYAMLHPDEECSAFLILNIRDPYLATKTYDALSERVRTGRMAQYMDSHISYLKKEILFNEKMKSLQPGMPAPLFALKDPKGKTIRLEKLRGKWLVLDFWGSWCFWCLHGVPKMREIYEKYPGKFQILGVDCNDTDKKWRDAMSKNNMPWMHVYDPISTNSKGEELEKSVAYMYAVNGFPTKVIIRPDGNIERFFYGEKEEFYEYLENLVK